MQRESDTFLFSCISKLKLHISVLDELAFSEDRIEDQRKHGGKNEANENKSDPMERGHVTRISVGFVVPTEDESDRTEQTAGTHAGVDRNTIHLQIEDADRKRSRDGGSKRGRDPDTWILTMLGT